MDSQIRISDLENVISEKVFIKIEKWNLYLGDAGLARNLAIECISNKDQGPLEAAKLSLKAINVKVGDGFNNIPLIHLITKSQKKLEFQILIIKILRDLNGSYS